MKIENRAIDYDSSGHTYSGFRRTDPRIAALVLKALGNAKSVINVGAGAGSYEPDDRYVAAVEPSIVMRSQRLAGNKVPAINAKSDDIPFDDYSFDASMAMLTVHHWPDIEKGIKEMKRVSKERVVIMTYDPDQLKKFWNIHYFPELIEIEKSRYPKIEFIKNCLNGKCEIMKVPIPLDCADGFQEAYYGRPEEFLKKEVRNSQSAWKFLPEGMEEILVKRLADDLDSGEWDKKFGHNRNEPFLNGALRLIVSEL
ncbi:MAG TPA: methyltransferase domain-containing protein [Ignavibacteria bacterium]|nr:methyltransferase domain-containing protein [Ignavibacteria bacterium]HMR41119.1 methyltransferase domain-containing protein [Ignavibacteria bacterium]